MCLAIISDGISERMFVDGKSIKVCFDCYVGMMWD